MIRLTIASIVAFSLLYSPASLAESSPSLIPSLSLEQPLIKGLWKTQDGRAKIEISPCAKAPHQICGTIVELREPIDPATGQEKIDRHNPDESLRSRKLLGLMNLADFKPDPTNSNHWIDGTIYSPLEGKTYSCEMTLIDNVTLEVHGYVGLPLFGKSQIWTRSSKEEKLLLVGKEG